MDKPSERLAGMNVTLPPAPKPVASYVPCVRHGDMLLLSGQIPVREGKLVYAGQVGFEQKIDAAQEAAKLCALNALAVAADFAGGVDNLDRVLKLVVYVASHEDFHEQHLVANGASDFLKQVFGERGLHARAAVGVAELPLNSTVEVDVTFTIKS